VQHAGELGPDDPRQVGRYRVLRRLGEGGQGVVYLATDEQDRQVALKLLRSTDPAALELLAREAAAARRVAPFCTAQVLDVVLDGRPAYVVSEYVPGPTLHQRVHTDGPLTGAALDRLAVSTATALMAIHSASLVHRDIKPPNVVLGPDGPRLLDFGIARDLSMSTGTFTAVSYGTPLYSAPERLAGRPYGAASDIFSWASTMAFAATGHPPFEGDDLGQVMYRIVHAEPNLVGVPEQLQRILRPCLAKDPAQRPVAQHLLGLLVGPGAAAAPTQRAVTEVIPGPGPTALVPAGPRGAAPTGQTAHQPPPAFVPPPFVPPPSGPPGSRPPGSGPPASGPPRAC